jgi:voltage-gated potassium channel
METVSEFDLKYHSYLVLLEWIITVLFTIEYIFRIISINRPWKYVSSFYGIIDLLAILPMYLSIFFLGTSIMTVVRSLRLLRLFKIKPPKIYKSIRAAKPTITASKG